MVPLYLTIHTTGNDKKGANAFMHGRYLQSLDGTRKVSWHYTVDEELIVQHIPDNESAWHAGDGNGPGNRSSIGIEICENRDGDFKKAVSRAITLIRYLQDCYDIPSYNVSPHQRWNGKQCPKKLLPRWKDFIRHTERRASPLAGILGRRVESVHHGHLRFYDKPSWEDKDVAGVIPNGYGFPDILEKVTVGSGHQYKVANSKGDIYYITASPKYVRVI
nr:N-acetylmuramoyl-L-alanine amidase [Thalassobacillus pellis]